MNKNKGPQQNQTLYLHSHFTQSFGYKTLWSRMMGGDRYIFNKDLCIYLNDIK